MELFAGATLTKDRTGSPWSLSQIGRLDFILEADTPMNFPVIDCIHHGKIKQKNPYPSLIFSR